MLYGLFMWDQFKQMKYLSTIINNINKEIIVNKRYIYQGIAKSFTIYFDNNEVVFNLSKNILTEYALANIVTYIFI